MLNLTNQLYNVTINAINQRILSMFVLFDVIHGRYSIKMVTMTNVR